jgi:hypothetical protein
MKRWVSWLLPDCWQVCRWEAVPYRIKLVWYLHSSLVRNRICHVNNWFTVVKFDYFLDLSLLSKQLWRRRCTVSWHVKPCGLVEIYRLLEEHCASVFLSTLKKCPIVSLYNSFCIISIIITIHIIILISVIKTYILYIYYTINSIASKKTIFFLKSPVWDIKRGGKLLSELKHITYNIFY